MIEYFRKFLNRFSVIEIEIDIEIEIKIEIEIEKIVTENKYRLLISIQNNTKRERETYEFHLFYLSPHL